MFAVIDTDEAAVVFEGTEADCKDYAERHNAKVVANDGEPCYEVEEREPVVNWRTYFGGYVGLGGDGECPDCGDEIFSTTTPGECCKNCGHVFWTGDPDIDNQY